MCDKFGVREETNAGPIFRVRHSNYERGALNHDVYPHHAVSLDCNIPVAVSIELDNKKKREPKRWLHAITLTWFGSALPGIVQRIDDLFRNIEQQLQIKAATKHAHPSRQLFVKSLSVSQELLDKVSRPPRDTIQEFPEYEPNLQGAVVASHFQYELVSSKGIKKLPAGMKPVNAEQINSINRPNWFEGLRGDNYSFIQGIYVPVTELVGI